MQTQLDLSAVEPFLAGVEIDEAVEKHAETFNQVLEGRLGTPSDLGWHAPQRWEADPLVDQVLALAEKIRRDGEVFVLVGVGGSNRGAQSVIETLGDRRVEIIYAGNTLSGRELQKVLDKIRACSTYVNVIAKDFNTLEPGIAFRVLRQALQETYGDDAKSRIIATGSRGPGQLFELSRQWGWDFLPFPEDMGGRFSVLSAVGLLPMAAAGVDIQALIGGAAQAARALKSAPLPDNPACRYAAARNLLFEKGYVIENLAVLEPSLAYLARWWVQLFGESEGKNQSCIFPTYSSYSEDLHAIGQYIQEGRRMIMETYIDARFSNPGWQIQPDPVQDGFDYLDGKPYDLLNQAVYQAAVQAHRDGGVPCFQFRCGEISARLFGELFYFFMLSCCLSAVMIGVDPFGQPGVEAYKRSMYALLGKNQG